jgi:hypothetical protein
MTLTVSLLSARVLGESPRGSTEVLPAAVAQVTSLPAGLAEALDEDRLPKDVPGLLSELSKRTKEVEAFVQSGELGQVWLPAMGSKTVVLVLSERASTLSPDCRTKVNSAARRAIEAAWLLDQYGDLGNREKMSRAYQRLADAVAEMKAAYEQR